MVKNTFGNSQNKNVRPYASKRIKIQVSDTKSSLDAKREMRWHLALLTLNCESISLKQKWDKSILISHIIGHKHHTRWQRTTMLPSSKKYSAPDTVEWWVVLFQYYKQSHKLFHTVAICHYSLLYTCASCTLWILFLSWRQSINRHKIGNNV